MPFVISHWWIDTPPVMATNNQDHASPMTDLVNQDRSTNQSVMTMMTCSVQVVPIMGTIFRPSSTHYPLSENQRPSMEQGQRVRSPSPVSEHHSRHWQLQQPDNSKFVSSTKDRMCLLLILVNLVQINRLLTQSLPTIEISRMT